MAQFVDGLRVFKPSENAPDFVKADVVINSLELATWLANKPDLVRIQLLESKKGSFYFAVNDYVKPENPHGDAVPESGEGIIIPDTENMF